MTRYAPTIFISALLLFQVQPLIARFILPWFGGTPAVWTTCMLFFQTMLLAGYFYAHVVAVRLSPRRQAIVHLSLLLVSLLTLPIIPDAAWKPQGDELPAPRILALLLMTVGIPYLLLATTGPLMQRWFSLARPGRSPYRLYALSNVGSLSALLTYPVLLEPLLRLENQALTWSAGYVLFVALAAWCGWQMLGVSQRASNESPTGDADQGSRSGSPATAVSPQIVGNAAEGATGVDPGLSGDPATTATQPPNDSAPPPRGTIFLWLGLAMAPSVMLLATTNQMCQEVAVVPFLWVLPLSLYLLSFIICFDSPRWYFRPLWQFLLPGAVALVGYCIAQGVRLDLSLQIAGYSLGLFVCCMACHGELARAKPDPAHLTLYFLLIAAGGALGGVFVVVAAPLLFPGYWELSLGLVASLALSYLACLRPLVDARSVWSWMLVSSVAVVVLTAGAGLGYVVFRNEYDDTVVADRRSFYGVLSVVEDYDDNGDYYMLQNGRIDHGMQYRDEEKRHWVTSYYAEKSGVGLALLRHPKRTSISGRQSLNLGVVGLGTGSLSAYGQQGDRIRFYEINPDVIDIATTHFTYTRDAEAEGAGVELELGDARIKMEQELAAGQKQHFDVLVVDAFSSDAIPMHLLTRECFELYWQHLREDGILAVHISNRYLDLRSLVRTLAEDSGHRCLCVEWDYVKDDDRYSSSTWVLVTNNEDFLADPIVQDGIAEWPDLPPVMWTDDYGSLLDVLDEDVLEPFYEIVGMN